MMMFNPNLCNDNGNGNSNKNINVKTVARNHQEKVKQIYQIYDKRSQSLPKKPMDKYPLKYYFYGMMHMKLNFTNTLKGRITV